MKHTFIAATALLVSPLMASASGLSGPFLGGYTGSVEGDDSGYEYATSTGTPDTYTQSNTPSGSTYGLLGGYNWILGNYLLLGVEGSYELRSADEMSFQKNSGVPDSTYPYSTKLDKAYALKAKIGFAFNEQHTAVYVTAGMSVADVKRTINDASIPQSVSKSESLSGMSYGVGFEHLLTDAIAARVDYSIASYDSTDINVGSLWTDTSEHQTYDEKELMLGLSYRF